MSSKPLEGKVGVVFGVANKRSIAWAIAQAWHEAGATLIFNYQGERLKENVEDLTSTFGGNTAAYPCDVTSDEQIAGFFENVKKQTNKIDLILHSVAFAPKEALEGRFVHTTRDAFKTAHDISAYSLVGVTRAALPFMNDGGSVVTMSYYGAEKVVPHYNVMGVAKAALEASVRYLAACRTDEHLGRPWNLRFRRYAQTRCRARPFETKCRNERTRRDRRFPGRRRFGGDYRPNVVRRLRLQRHGNVKKSFLEKADPLGPPFLLILFKSRLSFLLT